MSLLGAGETHLGPRVGPRTRAHRRVTYHASLRDVTHLAISTRRRAKAGPRGQKKGLDRPGGKRNDPNRSTPRVNSTHATPVGPDAAHLTGVSSKNLGHARLAPAIGVFRSIYCATTGCVKLTGACIRAYSLESFIEEQFLKLFAEF